MLCLNLIDNIAALFRRLFYTMKSMHMVMYTRVMCMYIELYALDNLLMDILVLRMAAALVGRPCSLRRTAAFGAIGCAYAIAALSLPALWSLGAKVTLGLVLALFIRPQSIRQYAENAAAVLISAWLAGGAAYALGGADYGGAVLLPKYMRMLLISGAAAVFMPRLVRHYRLRRALAAGMARLYVSIDGAEYELCALRDSGCFLTEPVTGAAVVIAHIPALLNEARIPVPLSTINGRGMIYALKPDRMRIDGADTDALLAISAEPIRGAEAIVPYHIAKESL